MKNTEHLRALRALLALADKSADKSATHEGLTNCVTITLARAALEELESASDASRCPLLERVRDWTLGDLEAAQESENGRTELDLATLHARADTLGE